MRRMGKPSMAPRATRDDDDHDPFPWQAQTMALVAIAMVGVSAVVIYLLHRETFSPEWSSRATRGGGGR